jgi:hypothetical protein
MTGTRRYTEREVATILRLAGKLDAHGLHGVTRAGGVSLVDIEAIAEDVGIDRAAVRAAAAQLEQQEDTGFLASLVGAPTLFRIERSVAHEIDTRAFPDLIASVQWTLGGQAGEVEEGSDSVTWERKSDEGPATRVEIARRDGETRIRLMAQHENPAGWTLIGTAATTVATSGALIAALEPGLAGSLAAIGSAALLNLLGARVLWRRHANNVRRKLRELADRLEAQIR